MIFLRAFSFGARTILNEMFSSLPSKESHFKGELLVIIISTLVVCYHGLRFTVMPKDKNDKGLHQL